MPDCDGVTCGADGCGGSCGTCGAGFECAPDGFCECIPDCSGLACGGDGCGGSCGLCAEGDFCNSGTCDTALSFATDLYPLISDSCASCHAARRPAMRTESMAYANLVGQPSTCGGDYVVPGNSGASYLVQKLSGPTCSGGSMPPSAAWPPEQVLTVAEWVEQGAQP